MGTVSTTDCQIRRNEKLECLPKGVVKNYYDPSYFGWGCSVGRGRLSNVGITVLNFDLFPKGCTFVDGALKAVRARHRF